MNSTSFYAMPNQQEIIDVTTLPTTAQLLNDSSSPTVETRLFFQRFGLPTSQLQPLSFPSFWARKISWTSGIDFFFLDFVSGKSANMSQLIAQEQLDWLKNGLLTSTATFKFIVGPMPISDFGFLQAINFAAEL